MKEKFRILLLEDNSTDAEIIQRFLLKEKKPYEFRLATDEKSFTEALDDFSPRLILSDNSMPQFNAGEALKITRRREEYIPFIMVTGTVSEEFAASMIKQGVDDYILKDRLNRLPAAVETALKKRKSEKEITDYKYALDQGYIVSLTDENGIIQYVNDNFCKISGYTKGELIGSDHEMVKSGLHSRSFITSLWTTISSGQIWKGEICNRTKSGSLYWVDTTIVPFLDEKGRPYQYLSMRMDVTSRKNIEAELEKSNERFKYATMASSDVIWELNFETKEYIVHEGKEKLFELGTVLDWQMGTEWQNIIAGDRERVKTSFYRARTDITTNLWEEEYRIHSVTNSVLHVSNHAIFIRNESGQTKRAIGAITDITEKKQLEADLLEQAANEQFKITATALDAQEKERNAIGEELHDNINQILLGTKLLLAVIKDDPEENFSLLNICIENLENAISENRKLAHSLVIPDFQSISLTEQLQNMTDYMLKAPGIDVHIDAGKFKEDRLNGESKLTVYRVAQEQCSNIVKYAGAKTVNIFLSTNASHFKMIISDDGRGVQNNKKSNGIGLKNIKARLSIVKGSVSIVSASGKGFTLEILIPLKTTE